MSIAMIMTIITSKLDDSVFKNNLSFINHWWFSEISKRRSLINHCFKFIIVFYRKLMIHVVIITVMKAWEIILTKAKLANLIWISYSLLIIDTTNIDVISMIWSLLIKGKYLFLLKFYSIFFIICLYWNIWCWYNF